MDSERLLIERARQGLSRQELAKRSGVNAHTVSEMERGVRNPRATTVVKIAEALGLAPEELLGKAPSSSPIAADTQAGEEQRGGGQNDALAAKLEQQLTTQLRALKERQIAARSDEDLHEAAKDFHHWWLFSFDWLSTFLQMHPEDQGPQLEEVVNRAGRAVKDEFPKDAVNPRDVPDMAEALREWTAHRGVDA